MKNILNIIINQLKKNNKINNTPKPEPDETLLLFLKVQGVYMLSWISMQNE